MKLRQRVIANVILAIALIPIEALADQFDDAVNEYIKGYKACTEANTLRTKSLSAAKRKFKIYLKHLETAKSIDRSILTTAQRDMDSNLRYCERVETNIKRAEATPILEKGFVYCDQAKDALYSGDTATAETHFDEYKRHRDDAMIITETIMDVFALASKVRSCARVEEKLAAAQEKENALMETIAQATTDYKNANKLCEEANQAISSPSFSLDKLSSVNAKMNASAKAKKQARKHSDAFDHIKAHPTKAESVQLQKLIDIATTCEGATSDRIRTATKNKRALEKDIDAGISLLAKSQQTCESAKSISEVLTSNLDVAKAEGEYKKSADLKRKVTSDRKLIATVKQYPSWKASNTFSKLMNNTSACHKVASENIKKQKAALALQQRKASQEAARQKQLIAEKKRLQEEKARKLAQEQQRVTEQRKQQELARIQAEEEARQAAALADVDDFDDADADDFDDFGDFGDNDDSKGKSWTDLVR